MDGACGEGGGQVLRTSLALSCLTGAPARVYNIRTGRKEPGLKAQHLLSVTAAAAVSNGIVEGASLGSTEVLFRPGVLKGGRFSFDVLTAGSIGLVFQTIVFPLSFSEASSVVTITGGTHVEWSPPPDFLREVFLRVLKRMGVLASIKTVSAGFYPSGGGKAEVDISPVSGILSPVNILRRGRLKRITVTAMVANLSLDIAKRETKRAKERLSSAGFHSEAEEISVSACGKGNFLFILAEFENIRAGFSSLGRLGKRAEQVADEAVEGFFGYMGSEGAIEAHLSDQLLIPMALAKGESVLTVAEISQHLRTNACVIEKFLPIGFSIEEGTPCAVRVKGVGFSRQAIIV